MSSYDLLEDIHPGVRVKVRFPPLYVQSSIFLSFDRTTAFMHYYGDPSSTYRVG